MLDLNNFVERTTRVLEFKRILENIRYRYKNYIDCFDYGDSITHANDCEYRLRRRIIGHESYEDFEANVIQLNELNDHSTEVSIFIASCEIKDDTQAGFMIGILDEILSQISKSLDKTKGAYIVDSSVENFRPIMLIKTIPMEDAYAFEVEITCTFE